MKPSFGLPSRDPNKKQPDPVTPLPHIFTGRNTDPLSRKDLVKRLASDKEQTDEHKAIGGYPTRTKFVDRIGRDPTELLFAAVRAHILQRVDKEAPAQIFVCKKLYLMLVEDIASQSHEGFTGKYYFPAWDGTGPIKIHLGLDYMLSGMSIPVNTVICVHKGG